MCFLLLAEIQGQRVMLAKLSSSNIDDPVFSGQLENKLKDMGDYPILLGDDENPVMDNIVDHSTPSHRLPRSSSAMKHMHEDLCLVDI